MSNSMNYRGNCFLSVNHVVCFGLLLGYKLKLGDFGLRDILVGAMTSKNLLAVIAYLSPFSVTPAVQSPLIKNPALNVWFSYFLR